jgi:tRNA (guanine37-N1)-methyltransferase
VTAAPGADAPAPALAVDVVTIFPDYLEPLRLSLIGRAVRDGLLGLTVHDLRDWTTDRHRTVDDSPYGGGAGMVMAPEPWALALESLLGDDAVQPGDGPLVVVPTPAGEPFTQALAHEFAAEPRLVFVCGRYEGIDARVLDWARGRARVREISLGDYVLNGGEVAVLVVVEAVARLVPGVIGNAASLDEESHADGLLEYPVFTKPAVWRGLPAPDVLLSGHHGEVARWRRDESLRRTAARRADLLAALDPGTLDARDLAVLDEVGFAPAGDGRIRPSASPVAD